MSLIGTGTSLRRKAQEGLTAVANLEAKQNAQEDALKMQDKAAETQMYGLGAGLGGAYGVNKALAASKAAGEFSTVGGYSAVPVSETTAALNTAVPGAGGTAGGVAGGEAVKAAGGEAIKAVGTQTAAGGSSGAMATLGTIAAPIAIGLGAAFLLNKLFG